MFEKIEVETRKNRDRDEKNISTFHTEEKE